MVLSLDSSRFRFEVKCTEDDIDEIVKIFVDGAQGFQDWRAIVGDTPREELLKWAADTFFRPRLADPIVNVFLIREISTG